MKNLDSLVDNEIIPVGSMIRLYGVLRYDVMKTIDDRYDESKKSQDYYEYILVDCKSFCDNTFILVNVTNNNNNRGTVLCALENMSSNENIIALQLKRFFSGSKALIELNI